MPKSAWNLMCLLCSASGVDLVAMQQHAMNEHGVTVDDLRGASSQKVQQQPRVFEYTLPDGRTWLRAQEGRAGVEEADE